MLQMIYSYNVKIPFEYNRFDINESLPDSEIRFHFEGKPVPCVLDIKFSISDESGTHCCSFCDKICINLDVESEAGTKNPNPYVMCEINGILGTNKENALSVAEEIVDKLCKWLSILFLRHNSNRHLYQPRVKAKWSSAVWNRSKYGPYRGFLNKRHIDKEGNAEINVSDHFVVREELYITSYVSIQEDEVEISKWMRNDNDTVSFLVNEFYSALGAESFKSKFFHLYAMIEFCEREYKQHNGEKRLLDQSSVDQIKIAIKSVLHQQHVEIDNNKVLSTVMKTLGDMTDIGRSKKLLNILHWMGINKISMLGCKSALDEELIGAIITLRNKSFHGADKHSEEEIAQYREAVWKLMYICEDILAFACKQNEDGIRL